MSSDGRMLETEFGSSVPDKQPIQTIKLAFRHSNFLSAVTNFTWPPAPLGKLGIHQTRKSWQQYMLFFIDNSTLLATKCMQLLCNSLWLVLMLCTEIEIDDCVSSHGRVYYLWSLSPVIQSYPLPPQLESWYKPWSFFIYFIIYILL